MNPATTTYNGRAELALVTLALIWGTSHAITKNILTTHTPFFYNSWRFGLAALCFGLLFAKPLRQAQRAQVAQGVLLGLLSFAGIVLYSIGLMFTAAAKAGFITGLYLVFTPLLALLIFRARPQPDDLMGLFIAVIGFGLLSYQSGAASFNRGDSLILLAALAWAAHIAATSAFARQSEVKTLAAVQVFTVALLAIFMHCLLRYGIAFPARLAQLEARPNNLQAGLFAQIVYMALVVTFLAALLQTWAQGKIAATHAVLLYALEPVTAAIFAWALLGERLTWRDVFGATLIVLGIFTSRLGLLQRVSTTANEKTLSVETS
jgi:drug/metabolite transporter (DMT)-like permease